LNHMLDSIEQARKEVDEHRAAETDLLAQLKDNEKMAAIGGMARGVAHELGAPLSVIDGRARRLQRSSDADSPQQREFSGIRAQVARLTSTVKQLLDYSRPAAATLRRTDPVQLTETALDAIKPEFEQTHIRLHSQHAANLPALFGDPARLELALLNLLRNALQAAHNHVEVSVSHNNNHLLLTVIDDGPGLPTENRAQLLEPFFTTKAPGEGTGLGLAIVQTIVEEHGGELLLGNRPEGGCQVCMQLPVHKEKSA